jgi:hypothetical protein
LNSLSYCVLIPKYSADLIKKNEMGGIRGTHGRGETSVQGFGGKARRKPLGRSKRRWEDGIRMDLREIG